MTITAPARERAVLERLRESYEGQGYQFFAYPPRELLPPFLGDFQPDAIALRDREGVVIEVKTQAGHLEEPRLSELAKRVAGHEGWRLEVFYGPEPRPDNLAIVAPTREQIGQQLSEIGDLTARGHLRAAFVLGWGTLEALARALAADGFSAPPLAPAATVEALVQQGLIDEEDARQLRALLPLRNAAVHGDLKASVGRDAVELLSTQLRLLHAQLPPANQIQH